MENEEKTEGVTIGEVFRTIFKRIWYILGASVLFTVAVVLILAFVINPLRAEYSMDFNLVFPSQEDYITYPDGSPFFYQEIVSKDFLTEACASDPALSGINIDRMSRRDEISITAETVLENNVTKYTGRYTVSVQASYFKSEEQAEQFIRALAEVPAARMKQSAREVDYTLDEKSFSDARFRERLALLAAEKQTLLSTYDGWIENYSETYRVEIADEDGNPIARRLKDFRDSVIALYGESVQTELESMLEEGGYDYYNLYPTNYREVLQSEYERNQAEIEAYEKSFGTVRASRAALTAVSTADEGSGSVVITPEGPLQRLGELITRNNRIAQWIGLDGRTATLTKENVDAFASRLEAEFETLNGAAKEIRLVVTAVYEKGMSVRFDEQRVTSSGTVGMVVGAIGAFLGGLIVACIVTYIVESGKGKKAAAEAAQPTDAPKE